MSRIDFLDNTTSYLRWIIIAMMKREGRNFRKCEVGGEAIPPGKFNIHHEKYEGATYRDLKIACAKCNHAPENVGLA
jgi:hypothetical protein